ncbi:hypothetical protein KAH94_06370 [bacterium]|nr:hypothetical protein [bacterium]
MKKLIISLCFLMTTGAILADDCCGPKCDTNECLDCEKICAGGYPYLAYRSQSINAARDLVGWQEMINIFDADGFNGAVSIIPHFTRSFKPCRIAGYYFGDDLQKGTLTISGSRKGTTATDDWGNVSSGNPKRESYEWLADNFGLAPTFESTVRFTPRISNFMVDLGLYVGFDQICKGAFFKVHAPLVYTKWELNMCEDVINTGTLGFQEGYMKSTGINRSDLPADFKAAMEGVTFGDMQEAIKYGKIGSCKENTKTRISDIEMALGWNFLQDEDYHFGIMARASLPTGNKLKGEYIFEPTVGAGGHFMLGAGFTSHVQFWKSSDEETVFNAYLDINVGHYFKTKQIRSFDLKGKKNSRYMLVQEMTKDVENLFAGTGGGTTPAPPFQYAGKLFPLINKTTCCTDVSIDFQADAVLKLAYSRKNFNFDVGYNVWGRTGEKFHKDCCTDGCLERNKYALKGDAFVYGFASTGGNLTTGTPVALSATQDLATINSGTNTPAGTPYEYAHTQNPKVDNEKLAWSDSAGEDELDANKNFHLDQTNTSYLPKLISCDDLNTCDTPSALSHKFFVNMSFSWAEDMEKDEWIPFLGLGGEVEIAGKTDGYYAAVSQWGVWVKGGLSFD